ncbi:MAG: hypothetical protein AAF789_07945 [Bacteroidota bacterium]
MVIISLLLTVASIVLFNMYQSFPSKRELAINLLMQNRIDSLLLNEVSENLFWEEQVSGMVFQYKVEPFYELANAYQVSLEATDSLGNEWSIKDVLVKMEDEE